MKKITLCISCVLLGGCFGDNDVQTLKKVVFPEVDNGVTVGEALDKRDMCKATSWDIQKKDKNVIDYTCELSDFNSMFESFRTQLTKKETKELTKRVAETKTAVEGIDSGIENLEKAKSLISELNAKGLFDKYVEGAKALGIEPNYGFITDESKNYVYRHNRKKDLQNNYIQIQKDIKEIADKYEVDSVLLTTTLSALSDKLGKINEFDKVTEYLDSLHAELKNRQNDNLDVIKDLKTKIQNIKALINTAHMAAEPKKIVQVVNFSKSKDKFSLQDCVFKLTLNDGKEVSLTSEHCFPMSYDKAYTDDYKKLFGHYYGTALTKYKDGDSAEVKQSTDLPAKDK